MLSAVALSEECRCGTRRDKAVTAAAGTADDLQSHVVVFCTPSHCAGTVAKTMILATQNHTSVANYGISSHQIFLFCLLLSTMGKKPLCNGIGDVCCNLLYCSDFQALSDTMNAVLLVHSQADMCANNKCALQVQDTLMISPLRSPREFPELPSQLSNLSVRQSISSSQTGSSITGISKHHW